MGARILIVSYHFYPGSAVGAKRMSELARELVAAGHEVVAVCAPPPAERSDPALADRIEGVDRVTVPEPAKLVQRLSALRRRWQTHAGARAVAAGAADWSPRTETQQAKESLVRRIKRWYHSFEWMVDDKKRWAWRASRRAAMLAVQQPFDCVISSGPPMSAHLAVLWARPLLRLPWIMDLRDPWTDDSEWMSHVHSTLSRRLDRYLERRCIQAADQVLTTTAAYADLLRTRFPAKASAIEVIYNGFDTPVQTAIEPPRGELRLLYAGSLYYNRNPFPLLKALAALLDGEGIDRRKVSFRLVGHCADWQGRALQPWLRARALDDCVSVSPPVPAAEVRELQARANVLVNFAQGQPRQIPAKMFEYLAAGREMLLLTEADSASAELARRTAAAMVVDPEQPEALFAALRELYERYVRRGEGYRVDLERIGEFSRSRQNLRLLDLIAGHSTARAAESET